MTKIAINGLGRIGRTAVRVWLSRPDLQEKLELVALNTSGSVDTDGWAHLLKYDSNYGVLNHDVQVESVKKSKEVTDEDALIGYLIIDGKKMAVLAQKDPAKIKWGEMGVETVIESTGVFVDTAGAGKHLEAGAKKVVISAPSKGEGIQTHVLGVNQYNGTDQIIDNASCTTNCIAPVVAVLHEKIGIKKAALNTIHSFTDDQRLQDGSHRDFRRSRAASTNIVPTSTGAALAVTKVIPELKDLFDGVAIRVPTPVGSLSDITFIANRETSVEEINQALTEASQSDRYRGIIAVTNDEIVSSDVVGRRESTIVDLSLTQVIGGDLVKVFAWYDNEWGYCNRLLEQAVAVSNQ